MMYSLYRAATYAAAPFIPALLRKRLASGKEDAVRLSERLGITGAARPEGKLVWIHAASVGEANSVLPLVAAMLTQAPSIHILLTTVTVTSAGMMRKVLPQRAIHQFAPVDVPDAVRRFLRHWKPDAALWVDSELWPNLIMETAGTGAVMGIVNGRISEKSFRSWRFGKPLIRKLLNSFTLCFAQSVADGERFMALGVPRVSGVGNLKYDAGALPCDEGELERLRQVVGNRPLWVAASTHPGEEEIIARIHAKVKRRFDNLLTVIVPRHAVRGGDIMRILPPELAAQRSRGDEIRPQTEFYVADTMGELGLFYRLAPVAFIGGTLVRHGGQNPLEAARLGCAVIVGLHYHNFTAIVDGMEREHAIVKVGDEEKMGVTLEALLGDEDARFALGMAAKHHVESGSGIISGIMKELQPYLA